MLLLAYVVGQLGDLIPLPGGVGGADGGLIAALVLYGTPLSSAAAAVLAYRAFQLGLPALLGGLAVAAPAERRRARTGHRRAVLAAARARRPAAVASPACRGSPSAPRAGSAVRRSRARRRLAAAGEQVRGDDAADRAEQVRLPGDPLLRQQPLQQPDPPDADDDDADGDLHQPPAEDAAGDEVGGVAEDDPAGAEVDLVGRVR